MGHKRVEVVADMPYVLMNGAILQKIAENCRVCVGRKQEIEAAEYRVDYQGQGILLCKAHAQQLLDGDSDQREKGGFFKEVFRQ